MLRELASKYILGLSGHFKFVLFGEWLEASNSIEGTCFFVFLRDRTEAERFEIKVRYLKRNYGDFDKADFIEHLSDEAVGQATYSLERSGEITVDSKYTCNDSGLRKIDKLISEQVYYFVKDCFHKHQHHEPSHDAILGLFESKNSDPNDWISKVQHSLYRQIIRFKRFRDENTLFRASGVLAYARAFEKSYEKSGKIRPFMTDELDKSLSVRRDEIYHFDHKNISKQQSTISFFFSVVAFGLSAAVLAQLDKSVDITVAPVVIKAVKVMATYPAYAIAACYIVAKAYQFKTYKSRPSNWPIVRNLYQIMRGQPLYYFNTLILFLAVSSAAIAFLILNYAR